MTTPFRRFIVLATTCTFLLNDATAHADFATTINPTTTWGKWDGWGTSLCWWANTFGDRDDVADLLFTTNTTSLNGTNLPGLGFNIARYNAGGCSTNSIDGCAMVVSPRIPKFKQIPGYWLNGSSSDPGSSCWDWTVDANQRTMLLKAKARKATLFELFSNSPMWWMCSNQNPSGSADGRRDNLQSSNYQSHAVYMATVAKYAATNWGLTFTSVEPFNEPVADWWKATNTQEGCHFEAATQAAVINHLRTELNKRGLDSMIVAASDESFYDQALSTWQSFTASTREQIGRVNVHGYQFANGSRAGLYNAVNGKKLWNSEYGDGDGTGISLAKNLNLDFHLLHMTGWCYWQPFDYGGWGLIHANPAKGSIGTINPKYYILAQYTRHIRPGMTIIDGGDTNTVAAYDSTAHKLVIVTANFAPPQSIEYNLKNFATITGPISRWMTTTGPGVKYAAYFDDVKLTNKTFSASFPTNSVQTFEIQGVDILPASSTGPGQGNSSEQRRHRSNSTGGECFPAVGSF